MKKVVMLALLMMFSVSMASAETVKQASENAGNFWSREAQRAGWTDSGSSWGKFWENVNPVNFLKNQQDAYNARKGGSAAK